jgi:hypothetical protein
MPVTLATWNAAIAALPPPGPAFAIRLGSLTAALGTYLISPILRNLEDLAKNYQQWKTICTADWTALQAIAQQLETDIANARNANPAIVGTVHALRNGYGNVVPDPLGRQQLPAALAVPAFTPRDVKFINEAFHRTHQAIEKAAEEMQKLRKTIHGAPTVVPLNPAQLAALPTGAAFSRSTDPNIAAEWRNIPSNNKEMLFVRLFGPLTGASFSLVFNNLMKLSEAFSNQNFQLVDGRNDAQYAHAFAAAPRGNVTSGVLVYICRSFFPANWSAVNQRNMPVIDDATIITLAHELAHACFNASDVPCVGTPHVLDPFGMPPPLAPVSNDLVWDLKLAGTTPALAMVNADNYGCFVYGCRPSFT